MCRLSFYTMNNKLQQIKDFLREQDAMALIKVGAPEHEYDLISQEIYDQLDPNDSIIYIQQKIWNIFYNKFCVSTQYQFADNVLQHVESHRASMDEAIKLIGKPSFYKGMAKVIKSIVDD